MVSCAGYRNPALVAKITSTIDVISGGRLDWGIGAGWYDSEYAAYGYDFPPAADRIRMLRETVEIVKLMWTEPDATYEGRHFSVRGAQCDPKPLQDPMPPIWIGGGGEQLTLRVVARHATHSNFGGKPDEFAHKCQVLRGHCDAVGRDYDSITKTWSPEVFIRPTEAEIVAGRHAQLLGRAVRVVARRQPGRHARAGRRAARGLPGPGLRRHRAVVLGLPRAPDARAARHRGHAALPVREPTRRRRRGPVATAPSAASLVVAEDDLGDRGGLLGALDLEGEGHVHLGAVAGQLLELGQLGAEAEVRARP